MSRQKERVQALPDITRIGRVAAVIMALAVPSPGMAHASVSRSEQGAAPKDQMIKDAGDGSAKAFAKNVVLAYESSGAGNGKPSSARSRGFKLAALRGEDAGKTLLSYTSRVAVKDRRVGDEAVGIVSLILKRSGQHFEPDTVGHVSARIVAYQRNPVEGSTAPPKRTPLYAASLVGDPEGSRGWDLYASYAVEGKEGAGPLQLPGTSRQGFGVAELFSLAGFINVTKQLNAVAVDVLADKPVEGYIMPPATPRMTNGYYDYPERGGLQSIGQ